ncbi:MAG: ribosome maturation factor [Bacteroidota bacterium]
MAVIPTLPTFAPYNESTEGSGYRSLLLFGMANEAEIKQLEKFLGEILADEPEYFLVSLSIKPTNNIKVFIDGDQGMPIAKCVSFNRKLYKQIEESGMYPEGDFSLELSSPGVDEPLKMIRQYTKNIGRDVEITFNDDTKKEGKLLSVTDADIMIEHTEGKGKKAVIQQLVVPFENIKTTIVQIKF